MKFTHQIQTRFALQGKDVMTISAVALITILIVLSRLAYVPFIGDMDIEGSFLKFKWLSSFLYTFGVELAFLCSGFLLYHASYRIESSVAVFYRIASHVIASLACFFMCWIFIEQKYFNMITEIVLSSVVGTSAAFACFFIQRRTVSLLTRMRNALSLVIESLVEDAPNFMEPKQRDNYDEQVVWPTLKNVVNEIGGEEEDS